MSTVNVNLTEARRNWGEIINRVAYGGERILLLSRGKPKAAIVSVADLAILEQLREQHEEEERLCQFKVLEEARALRERILQRRGSIPLIISCCPSTDNLSV
jgi:prevent-host-death family protein